MGLMDDRATAVFESAYQIAVLQAAVDGAIDERLLRQWFEAAWELCAAMIGFEFPQRTEQEQVEVSPRGTVRLSRRPSGPVKLYAGGTLVATLPPSSALIGNPRLPNPYTGIGERAGEWNLVCSTSLCCYCNLVAIYPVGSSDPCTGMPATFLQAVARLFAYMCENRGDVEMDESILSKSGAKAFLSPQITYLM
jgi:hypothetical protein